ncbi:MAG: hypothetical protein AAF367_08910 [Pseudomonadota bacterium]
MRAVVSYVRADGAWARKLSGALRAFRVPAALHDGAAAWKRKLASVHLIPHGQGAITRRMEDALMAGECLCVIASPKAAANADLNDMIADFRARRPDAPVIALTVAGVADAVRAGHAADRESLPKAVLSDLSNITLIEAGKDKHSWDRSCHRIEAAVMGLDTGALRGAILARRRRRQFWGGVVSAMILLIGGLGFVVDRDARAAAARDLVVIHASDAQAALDAGDVRAALLSLDQGLSIQLDRKDDMPMPPALRAALTRVTLDTRLLADMPSPVTEAAAMRLLPTGVLAMTEPGGRTHLVDLGTGAATTVYDPESFTHTRISADGATLWTAHAGPEAQDENGDLFVPLIFEEAELATGNVRLTTAVQSVPIYGDAAEISPDGSLFAVDLGAGAGDNTVIGVFHRQAQALAGVLTLPSDRARIWFAGSNHLLAVIDPPGTAQSRGPGIYLWRIGNAKPQTLRSAGAAVTCTVDGQSGRNLALSVQTMDLNLTADRTELTLGMATADGGGCIRRWSLPDGTELPDIALTDGPQSVHPLGAGGPYLVRGAGDEAYLARPGGEADIRPISLQGCEGDIHDLLRAADGGELIFCAGPDDAALLGGRLGGPVWRGRMHEGGVAAHVFDPAGRRLITLGRDGRLRIWDTGARGRMIDAAPEDAKIIPAQGGRLLAIAASEAQFLKSDGSAAGASIPLDPQSTVAAMPLAGGHIGVARRMGSGSQLAFSIHDSTSATGSAEPIIRFDTVGGAVVKAVSSSANGLRLALLDRNGQAHWGRAVTGENLSRIDIGDRHKVVSAHAGMSGYVVVAVEKPDSKASETQFYVYSGGDDAAPGIISEKHGQRAEIVMSPRSSHALLRLETATPVETRLILIDLTSGAEVEVARFAAHDVPFGFSASGSYLHAGPTGAGNGELLIADTASGRPSLSVHLAGELIGDLVWASDRDVLAVAGPRLTLLNAKTDAAICPDIAVKAGQIALSPKGTRIALRHEGPDGDALLSVFDLDACASLTRRADIDDGGRPVFAGENRVWVPQKGGVRVISLDVDAASARQWVVDRVRRLSDQ